MPIDTSIYNNLQPVKIDSPLNMLAQVSQIKRYQSDDALLPLKIQDAQQKIKKGAQQNKLLEMFAGGQSLSDGSGQGNALTPGGAAGAGAIVNGKLNLLNALAVTGYDTRPLLELYKYESDGTKLDPGTFRRNPMTGATEFVPDVKNGLDFDPKTKTVTALPGYAGTNAAIKGAETAATEQAKATYDPLPTSYVGPDGRPVGGSRLDYLGVPENASSPSNSQPVSADSSPAFVGHELLMQIPEQDRMKILRNAQASGDSAFSLNYRLPNGQMIRGQVDMGRDSTGNVPAVYQQKADYMRSQATPEERQQFEQQALQSLTLIKDPSMRAAAVKDFYAQMAEPAGTPIRMFDRSGALGSSGKASAPGASAAVGTPAGTRPQLQSEAEKKLQLGQIDLTQGAQGDANKNWIAKTHNPIQEAGRAAQENIANLDALKNIDIKTGWGTEAAASAANVLTGLGIASNKAADLASNSQKFQSIAMERLWSVLNQAKGPQTEGDADRAKQTFASLKNTPQANQFILDLARAKANLDVKRAQYYSEALPLAIHDGDLTKVDREWSKVQPSVWSDPALQKYTQKGGK